MFSPSVPWECFCRCLEPMLSWCDCKRSHDMRKALDLLDPKPSCRTQYVVTERHMVGIRWDIGRTSFLEFSCICSIIIFTRCPCNIRSRCPLCSSLKSLTMYLSNLSLSSWSPEQDTVAPLLHSQCPGILTRSRSGYHWLGICQGRYSKTPRDMRCCPNCTGVIEDEHHALVDCPMYNDLREEFRDLFHDDCRTLVKLFSFDQDYTKLARFFTLCRERQVQKSV
jgi:hypothetical protein